MHDNYVLDQAIGQGKYGSVFRGHCLRDPEHIVAIKVIKIRKIKSNFESVMKEIEIMKLISHPDIVKVLALYKDPKKLYIVMEYVRGKELYDFIIDNEKLEEGEARLIVDQLIQIVKYLNSLGI